jgi:hypothetical protein
MNNRLRHGEPTEIIGRAGRPIWHRTVLGDPRLSIGPDGTFSVASKGASLIELNPGPSLNRYRLRVQVRHNGGAGGRVGFYVARHAAAKDEQWMIALVIADHVDETIQAKDDTRRANSGLRVVSVRKRQNWRATLYGTLADLRRHDELGPPCEWHSLALEVTPTAVTAFWDDKFLGELSGQSMADSASVPPSSRPIPSYSSVNGLGLFVEDADASFRGFEIAPPSLLMLWKG